MKNKIFFIIFLFSISIVKANFYEIDVSNRVINFSSFCKQGHITVFIMSQHGCSPCITAKHFFKDTYENSKIVDVYYCMRTKNKEDLRGFQNRPSTLMWGYVEAYTSSPRIYIFSPTGNPQGIYSGFNKEKISYVMNGLIGSMKYYKTDLVTFNNRKNNFNTSKNCKIFEKKLEYCETEYKKILNKNKTLNAEIYNLRNEFKMLINDSFKIEKKLKKEKDTLKKTNLQYLLKIDSLKKSIIETSELLKILNQNIAKTWYKLAKENEKEIMKRKQKKDIKKYFIIQTKKYYELSIKSGIKCEEEYEQFKKKYYK